MVALYKEVYSGHLNRLSLQVPLTPRIGCTHWSLSQIGRKDNGFYREHREMVWKVLKSLQVICIFSSNAVTICWNLEQGLIARALTYRDMNRDYHQLFESGLEVHLVIMYHYPWCCVAAACHPVESTCYLKGIGSNSPQGICLTLDTGKHA
jgi:hypothetical protein